MGDVFSHPDEGPSRGRAPEPGGSSTAAPRHGRWSAPTAREGDDARTAVAARNAPGRRPPAWMWSAGHAGVDLADGADRGHTPPRSAHDQVGRTAGVQPRERRSRPTGRGEANRIHAESVGQHVPRRHRGTGVVAVAGEDDADHLALTGEQDGRCSAGSTPLEHALCPLVGVGEHDADLEQPHLWLSPPGVVGQGPQQPREQRAPKERLLAVERVGHVHGRAGEADILVVCRRHERVGPSSGDAGTAQDVLDLPASPLPPRRSPPGQAGQVGMWRGTFE